MDLTRFPPDGQTANFEKVDGFYLLSWCRDLKHLFPFLDERGAAHPYSLFFFLWKLSYLYGRHFAHYSLAMEELIEHPERELHQLFALLDINRAEQDLTRLKRLIVKPEMGKWRKYASEDWFRRQEETCEQILDDFFGNPRTRREGDVTPASSYQCVP